MPEDASTKILTEILVWTRVGFYGAAKSMLADVLNSDKRRFAYQSADGVKTNDAIRVATKMSPNDISDLFRQCVSLGLMEVTSDGKRHRLFDLSNFGLMPQIETVKKKGAAGDNG